MESDNRGGLFLICVLVGGAILLVAAFMLPILFS